MAQRKIWDRVKMKNAVMAVKNKEMGTLRASKVFDVPRSTIKDYVKKPVEDLDILLNLPLGRKTVLPPEVEDELVEYCLVMEKSFYGLTAKDLKRMAFQLAIKNNIKHTFSESKKSAGRKWMKLFFQRHPGLTLRKPQPLSLARIRGFTKENVDKFYSVLKPELERVKYQASRIFNVDESGVTSVQHKSMRVVSLKGKREIHKLSSAERGRLVTLVVCMSASGVYVPPMLVFPRKRMKDDLLDGAPPGSIGGCHTSGWIQADLFTKWMNHFINHTKPSKEDPVVLILDGHSSHTRNVDVIDMARNNGVSIVCLPPHSSHRMQPLDRTFMKTFKTYYAQEIENWLAAHPFRAVTVDQIGELVGKAYIRTATMNVALKGFECTGILPFNNNIFNDADFLENQEENADVEEAQSRPIQDAQNRPIEDFATPGPSQIPKSVRPTGSKATGLIGLSESQTPHKAKQQTLKPISPRDINPVPVYKKPPASLDNRKRGSAALISGSPYKNALLQAQEKKKPKPLVLPDPQTSRPSQKQKKNVSRKLKTEDVRNETKSGTTPKKLVMSRVETKKPKKNKKFLEKDNYSTSESEKEPTYVSTDDNDSSDNDDNDAQCPICDGFYSKDIHGEKWVKCCVCFKWCHEKCDPNAKAIKKVFKCVFCC